MGVLATKRSKVLINQMHSHSPLSAVTEVTKNFGLIYQMVKREVIGRYRGSIMGLMWSFFNPLLMLAIYTLVFSVVFKTRWPGMGEEQSKTDFAILFFGGLIIYGLVAECINGAPNIVVSNVNYVKKVVFPLQVLPVVAVGSALFHMLVSVLVLLLAELIFTHRVPWTAILFPFILVPLLLGVSGLTWFISALGVFVRDISQVTGMLTTVLLFLSPIFYPVSAMPPGLRGWLAINPLVYFLEEGRNTLIYGRVPDFSNWLIAMAASMVVAWLGFIWFQKSRRAFSDVL